MLIPFRKVASKSDDVKHLQDALSQIFNQIQRKQIIDGVLISDISIVSGTPESVDHGLGINPRGWIIIKKDANANVWQSDSSTPTSTLILNSSADVTISLWVF